MRRIRIEEGRNGLVFKNRECKRVLTKGVHWLNFNEECEVHLIKNEFSSYHDLDILLKNKIIAPLLTFVEVKEEEIYLMYDKGVFQKVIKEGTVAFWKEMSNYSFQRIDISKASITQSVSRAVLAKLVTLSLAKPFEVCF